MHETATNAMTLCSCVAVSLCGRIVGSRILTFQGNPGGNFKIVPESSKIFRIFAVSFRGKEIARIRTSVDKREATARCRSPQNNTFGDLFLFLQLKYKQI